MSDGNFTVYAVLFISHPYSEQMHLAYTRPVGVTDLTKIHYVPYSLQATSHPFQSGDDLKSHLWESDLPVQLFHLERKGLISSQTPQSPDIYPSLFRPEMIAVSISTASTLEPVLY